MDTIINKVSESGLLTIDPADFYTPGERAVIDLKPLLVEEFLLREKDFREYVKGTDWSKYQNTFVAIHCSNDAIIPVWAYMLLTVALEPFAAGIFYGTEAEMEQMIFKQKLMQFDPEIFRDKRIVIKGCGDIHVPESVYMELTRILRPVVKSIMYGEPCSTVPVYKKTNT
jgi:hypothetical protein